MTNPSPVERAARALAARDWDLAGNDGHRESVVDRRWPRYVPTVLTVLQAIREPTQEMEEAARDTYDPYDRSDRLMPEPCWQAMIDVLIEEAKG